MQFCDLTKIIIVFLLLLSVGCASVSNTPSQKSAQHPHPFAIPQNATFKINSYGVDPSQSSNSDSCKMERPTEKDIIYQFQVAHQVSDRELHDSYLWTPCYADGTISQNGKVMKWRFRIGNVIETTFPDGEHKTLGGEPTDSPSGEQ